jgi:hypothetical protein
MRNVILFISFLVFSVSNDLYGQTEPILIIDGQSVMFKSDVSFPYWLKSGQTIDIGPNVKFVSILEFNVDSSTLNYSQTISLSSIQAVPASKTWKVEAVAILWDFNSYSGFSNSTQPSIFVSPRTYSSVGDFTFVVPASVFRICVEAWGPGGGLGGGGGGYGYSCFNVTPGNSYNIHIGRGESYANDSTAFGNLLVAWGGRTNVNGAGVGGTSNGSYSINGANAFNTGCGWFGGDGANGGNGGKPHFPYYNCTQAHPQFPGGGGATQQDGASGQIKIYW